MGAWGSTFSKNKSKEECAKDVRDFCETENVDLKEIKYYDLSLKTPEEAKEFLQGKADKWGPAVAVSYLDLPSEIRETANKKKLDDIKKNQIPSKNKEINAHMNMMGELRKNNEVEYIKCNNCGSKISSKYLVGFGHSRLDELDKLTYGCPACNERGMVPKSLKAELKKLAKLCGELADLNEAAEKLKKKVENENARSKYWMVEVWIPT